jgi:GrpB-like predicted nucleotidyltransferase (UPF0157 family)
MQFITEYSPDWPRRFAELADYLRPFMPSGCFIHHVGSTSIPGMPAKDIIDLIVQCADGSIDQVIAALARAGYEHQGDLGITTRQAFRPCPQSPTSALPPHHLYACEASSPELAKQLAFRDYLRAQPDRARWLACMKIAADAHATSRDDYIHAKSDAYAIITREAISRAKQRTRT